MSRWRPATKPSWTLLAAVLTAVALAQSTWALDKDGVVEAESAVTELASTIATLYRNKCTVTASCPQSVSAMGRDLTPYLDTVDTRVQDVCLCITTPFFFHETCFHLLLLPAWCSLTAATARGACAQGWERAR